MKIAFLVISDIMFGGENAVLNLSYSIKNLKIPFLTMINNEIYDSYNKLGKNAIAIGKIKKGNFIRNLIAYKEIKKNIEYLVEKENPDLINVHLSRSFFAFYSLYKKIDKPILINLHGSEINHLLYFPKNKYELLDKICLKRALDNSSKIISVGKEQIQNLPEKYKQKTIVIPNGVDSKIFKPLKKIKPQKNVILFAGRFIELKGINEILAVAKQLPQYEFWFAGQGELSNLINLSNTKNLGFKTTEELVKLYNQANICIFPSYRESFGLVGLEAMSCGKAVIATPLGFSEYIENGKDGIIIPAKDENALKNAILDLMTNDKKRKSLENNARKKALLFSWDKVAAQYLQVFTQVLNENKTAPQ